MDVSIIIVNYNTKKITQNCLNSIFKHTFNIDFEVILVDNNSHDGSVDFFKSYPNIKFFPLNENIGFGRANNYGFQYAQGKYVLLLNSDTVLLNNAVKIFYDYFEYNNNKQNIGVLGCVLIDMDNKNILSFAAFPSIHNHLKVFGQKIKEKIFKFPLKTIFIPMQDVFFVDAVIGADMFLPHVLYENLKGFDSNYFMYGEEVEFQKRIADINLNRLIIKEPRIIHIGGSSSSSSNNSKRLSYFTIYNMQIGDLLFINKHYSILYYIIYVFFQLCTWYPWILISKRFSKSQKWNLLKLLLITKSFKNT
jgi:GT2 family glycosyltransferase